MDTPLDDQSPLPEGELISRFSTRPHDANAHGDIYAGWLVNQMDTAGASFAQRCAKGKVTTVAISDMVFLCPVPINSTVSFYAISEEVGRSSIRITVEVWLQLPDSQNHELIKVTEGKFVFVAIDNQGRTRPIN